jgi:hypothetical protein
MPVPKPSIFPPFRQSLVAARSCGRSPGSHSGQRIKGFSTPFATPTVVPRTPGNFPNMLLKLRFSSIT